MLFALAAVLVVPLLLLLASSAAMVTVGPPRGAGTSMRLFADSETERREGSTGAPSSLSLSSLSKTSMRLFSSSSSASAFLSSFAGLLGGPEADWTEEEGLRTAAVSFVAIAAPPVPRAATEASSFAGWAVAVLAAAVGG